MTEKYHREWVNQAIKEGHHPFFIQIPITYDFKQDAYTIKGLGSKVERSRTGHRMSQEFINKMKQTSVNKPSFWNHDPNQIVGKVTGMEQSAHDEYRPVIQLKKPVGNDIVDAPPMQVQSCMQNDIPLGLSIGGRITDVDITDEQGYTIDVKDGEVMEWTVTPIPALVSSDNSVQTSQSVCKDGVCNQIASQIQNGFTEPQPVDMTNLNQSFNFLNQSKTEFNQSLEDDSMTKEEKTVSIPKETLDQLTQTVAFLAKNEKEKLEQAAIEAEKQKENDLINRITQQVTQKLEQEYKQKEEDLLKTVSESAIEVIKDEAGFLFKNREHVQQSAVETPNVEGTTVTESVPVQTQVSTKLQPMAPLSESIVEQRIRDPVNYPSTVLGKVMEGYTPEEFVTQILEMA